MLDAFQLVDPPHELSVGHPIAIGQDLGTVGQVVKARRQAFEKIRQSLAAGTVHGRDTGDEGIHQPIQFTAEEITQGIVAPLTVPVEGDLFTVSLDNRFTEATGVQSILLTGHRLESGGGVNILQNADIGREPLVGKAVGVAALLAGQKGENIGTQHIGREYQNRLGVTAGGGPFLGRRHPIQQKPIGLIDQRVLTAFEMKTEFRSDGIDGLGIPMGDLIHQFGLVLGIASQRPEISLGPALLPGGVELLKRYLGICQHHLGGTGEAAVHQFDIVVQQPQIGFVRVAGSRACQLCTLGPLKIVAGEQKRNKEIGAVAGYSTQIALGGGDHIFPDGESVGDGRLLVNVIHRKLRSVRHRPSLHCVVLPAFFCFMG